MPTPLESLVASGTKLWLDSIDPDLVVENRKFGATGATSNPIIISDLLRTGRFDDQIRAGRGRTGGCRDRLGNDRSPHKQAREILHRCTLRPQGNDQ